MQRTILHLPDNSIEYITSSEDFAKLIEEKMGQEARTAFESVMERSERVYWEAETDLGHYEEELGGLQGCLNEILDRLEETVEELQRKRVDKKRLLEIVTATRTEIHNYV